MAWKRRTWAEGEKGKATDLNNIEEGIATGVNLGLATFNVKGFGAVGDGVTDDTTAIQAAFTAAGPPGEIGVVYIPPGYYYVSKGLKVPEQVTVYGLDWRVTVLEAHGEFNLLETGQGDVVIEGLFLRCVSPQTAKGAAVDFSHGTTANVQLRNLQIGSNFYNGLYLVGETAGVGASIGNVLLENIRFEDTGPVKNYGNAAIVSGSSTRRISVLRMTNVFGFAATKADMPAWFKIVNTDSLFFTNGGFQNGVLGMVTGEGDESALKTTNLAVAGVWFDGGSEGMNVGYKLERTLSADLTGCHAQGCSPGLRIGNEVAGLNVTGGQYYHNYGSGIHVTGGASPTYGTNITGVNIVTNCEAKGVAVAEQCGIYFEKKAGGVTVSGCTIGNPTLLGGNFQKYGVYLEGENENVAIVGNRICKNVTKNIEDKSGVEEKAGGGGTEKKLIANNLVT